MGNKLYDENKRLKAELAKVYEQLREAKYPKKNNLDQLVEVALDARKVLRQIAEGEIRDYERPGQCRQVAANINAALIPFVGIGVKTE